MRRSGCSSSSRRSSTELADGFVNPDVAGADPGRRELRRPAPAGKCAARAQPVAARRRSGRRSAACSSRVGSPGLRCSSTRGASFVAAWLLLRVALAPRGGGPGRAVLRRAACRLDEFRRQRGSGRRSSSSESATARRRRCSLLGPLARGGGLFRHRPGERCHLPSPPGRFRGNRRAEVSPVAGRSSCHASLPAAGAAAARHRPATAARRR